ncbi:MAG: precorrin-6y C5,15-methyltransferase (decarboxylating) subunit CbiE [Synergistaceae bacterium]|nr:precorrin-6y C5,15-methyltransferase (decarboxylating) subunit CbiE [Synergistaceae bacterium]
MLEIIIAGEGTGLMTQQVREALNESDTIFAHERFRALINDERKFIALKNFNDAFNFIDNYESAKILFLVSGDPCLYSLLPLVKKRFPNADIKVLPGISSLQVICSHACETWNGANIISGHGRLINSGAFLNSIERNRVNILFCDKNFSPEYICSKLESENISGLEVFIGERLGSESEKIYHGLPKEFINHGFSQPAIILIRNNNIYVPERLRLRDKDFIRSENIHITHELIRAAILDRLELDSDSILFDIGAGTGSISISAGHEHNDIEIHSIEYKHEAVNLISRNIKKFHLHNITLHEGRAIGFIKSLPIPSHVFIGGSGGELAFILEYLASLDESIRLVLECVTLETLNTAFNFMSSMKNFEALQISASVSKNIADSLTLMKANNPVMILCADSR